MREPTAASRSPWRIALSVKGWRCFLGFHSYRARNVCERYWLGGGSFWEVYEECVRCGCGRSYDERNRRVAAAIRAQVPLMSDAALKPELDAALMALPGGIGLVIRYVKAAPVMSGVMRLLAEGYFDVLPEELTEPIKVALDLLDGGDGVIYR